MRRFSLFLIFLLAVPAYAQAASTASLSAQIESVRKERDALVAEQERLQAELDRVTAEGRTLGTAVKSLDATKKKLAADIRVTQSKITSAELNIRVLQNGVAEKEEQIVAHRKAIADALQAISDADRRPITLDLVAAANFSAIWADMSQLAGLSGTLEDEVDNLRLTRSALVKQKEEKEKVKAQALSLSKELTGQKVVVEESQKAKERLLAETKEKEAAYQAMLAENLARQKQFEEDLYRLESQLNITLDPTKIPDPRHGLLSWPLASIFVTTKFGAVSGAALRVYASGSHNGVDFRASQGTPVKAVAGGVVAGAGNTDEQRGCGSYGRWVLIDHKNGLSTVYAHLSASLVRAGQEVGAGEVIGYSGGTPGVFGSGYSTGPHLHLGLFATQGVEVRQFTESRGCKQVVVPIADVKAYLDPLAYLPNL
jgi:murein DD-endopeptidase MepM/ murein hydrolase activator NlpD